MNDDQLNNQSAARATALLGLLAQTGNTQGPEPSAGELGLYLEGGVGEERAAQIKSHIAHNPDVFTTVLELRNARESAAKDPAQPSNESANVVPLKKVAPSKAVWWGTGALAASVMLVALMFFTDQSVTPTQNQRIADRPTSAPTQLEQQAAYMREGYQHGSTQALSTEQMSLAGTCGEDCSMLATSLIRFGALVRDIEQTCQSSNTVGMDLRRELQNLAEGTEAIKQAPWASYASTLHNAAKRSDKALCKATSQLSANLQ